MPKTFGGAQNLRRGDRIRVSKTCYRHFLSGLTGRVTGVLHHGVIIALDNDPQSLQKIVDQGQVGPKNPTLPQRIFQFHEIEKLPTSRPDC